MAKENAVVAVGRYHNAGDRMKCWGKLGAFWGGMWGLLFGGALLVVAGMGPVLTAGPLVTWIVWALEGAVVAGVLSAMGAGVWSIRIPRASSLRYEVAKAKQTIQRTSPKQVEVHSAT